MFRGYRLVYDWLGDRRFHLIPVRPASALSSGMSGRPAQSPASCPGAVSTASGGTPNYISLFSGSSPSCDIENSNIYQGSSGNIGIGTSSPTHALDLQTSTTAVPTELRVTNTSTITNSIANIGVAAAGSISTQFEADSGLSSGLAQGLLGTFSNDPLSITTHNLTRMFLDTSGNVGIGTGTATPAAMLEVNGTAKFDNTVTFLSSQTFPNTISDVVAGTDLTGGGTTPTVTLNVDTTKVPQLATANTFTASQTVNGNMTVQGPSPWIDVTSHGADPTGTSDSTAAINSAINACPQTASGGNSNGCTVFFPPGKYRIAGGATNGIQITQNNLGVRLMGAGAASATNPAAASELVNYMSGANYVVSVAYTGSTVASVTGVVISNLGFVDNTPGTSTGGAILLHDAQYFSIDGVSCSQFSAGACIAMEGDSGPPTVYTQYGSIKDLFSQALYGITTAGTPIISEVTILGGNISCLTGSGVLANSVGINFNGNGGHIGENQIFGTAVNDCNIGYQLVNTGATHIVGKFECDTAGMTNCGAEGLLMDNQNSSMAYSNGNVITLQVSRASVGIQVNAMYPAIPPGKEQIIGGTFQGNTGADICINSSSLPSALVLVAPPLVSSSCPSGNVVTGSQFPVGVAVASVNGSTDTTSTWTAGALSSGAPPTSLCTAAAYGSLYTNTGTSGNYLWVCQNVSGTPTWVSH
jgi:Pectate lyase superfamily protein